MTSDLKPRRKPARKRVNIRFYAAIAMLVLIGYLYFMSRAGGAGLEVLRKSSSAASELTRLKPQGAKSDVVPDKKDGKDVKSGKVDGKKGSIKDEAKKVIDSLDQVKDGVVEELPQEIKDATKKVKDVKDKTTAKIKDIKDSVPKMKEVKDSAANNMKAVKDAAGKKVEEVKDAVPVKNVKDAVGKKVEEVKDAVKEEIPTVRIKDQATATKKQVRSTPEQAPPKAEGTMKNAVAELTDAYKDDSEAPQKVEKIEVQKKGTTFNAAKDIPAPKTENDAYDAANALSVLLETYDVILFSKTYCPHSKKAKTVLGRYSISPTPLIFELDVEEHGPSLQAALAKLTGRATVPNLMVKGKSLGGGDELMTLDRTDTLIMKIRTISESIDVTKKSS